MSEEFNILELSKSDIIVLRELHSQNGGAPAMIASSIGTGLDNILTSIDKLEGGGFVKKDKDEIRKLGKKWAFCSLTEKGHGLTKALNMVMEIKENSKYSNEKD